METPNPTLPAWAEKLESFLIYLLITTLVLVGHTLSFNKAHADRDSSSNDPSYREIRSGELRLTRSGDQDSHLALLDHTDMDVTITGMVASVIVRQTFTNDSNEWVSGEYTFPLPEESAVHYMQMQIGERTIVGKIREKEQARAEFIAAKKAGKKVSLVEQQRPNMFTNRVANIAPGETIHVELHYLDIARYDQGRFSLRFPTTITPRYIPGTLLNNDPAMQSSARTSDETSNAHQRDTVPQNTSLRWGSGWALATDLVPDAASITPMMKPSSQAAPLSLSVKLDAGLPLASFDSLYHPATTQQHAYGYQLTLDRNAKLNRDVVVEWQPQTGMAPHAAAFSEHKNGENYVMLMVVPPQPQSGSIALPKETLFIIDTSGSMAGNSIRQAKQALVNGLSKLKPSDRFNIIEFNSHATRLWPQARQANGSNINLGKQFVQALNANGGTEMSSALSLAFENQPTSEDAHTQLRQVIFITDGSVGNESALFEQIEQQRGASRLFTVGIGSAPNSYFMKNAAEAGRGSFTYIGAQNDIQREMSDLFYKLEYPVLTDLALSISKSNGENNTIEIFPSPLPDLYAGEPIIAAFKSSTALPSTLMLTGNQATPFSQTVSLTHAKENSGISQLWARKKLKSLYNLERKAKFNNQSETLESLKQEITQLALSHQLMSRHTSFIAIEEKVSRPPQSPLKEMREKNAMPEGNTMPLNSTARIPQGSLGIPWLWFITALCFALTLCSSSIARVTSLLTPVKTRHAQTFATSAKQ